MTPILRTAIVLLCLAGLASPPVSAVQATKGKQAVAKQKSKSDKKKGDRKEPEFSLEFLIDFRSEDARRFAAESKLVGQKPLPPGIRKNLARGKPMPPGIAKREMPETFLRKLPSHDDYEWHMAGTDLLLVARSDRLVVEIAADIFK